MTNFYPHYSAKSHFSDWSDITVMTLGALIRSTSWAEVKASRAWLSRDNSELLGDYRAVFLKLRQIAPAASSMRICVETTIPNEIGAEPAHEVCGKNGTLNRDLEDFEFLGVAPDSPYAREETAYSLALEPWKHWLGMAIEEEALNRHSAAQIVALCMDEMTFHGFEEWRVQVTKKELQRRVAELDAMTEEEKRRKLVPASVAFEGIRRSLGDADNE